MAITDFRIVCHDDDTMNATRVLPHTALLQNMSNSMYC